MELGSHVLAVDATTTHQYSFMSLDYLWSRFIKCEQYVYKFDPTTVLMQLKLYFLFSFSFAYLVNYFNYFLTLCIVLTVFKNNNDSKDTFFQTFIFLFKDSKAFSQVSFNYFFNLMNIEYVILAYFRYRPSVLKSTVCKQIYKEVKRST